MFNRKKYKNILEGLSGAAASTGKISKKDIKNICNIEIRGRVIKTTRDKSTKE